MLLVEFALTAFAATLQSQPLELDVSPSTYRYRVDRWTMRDGLPLGEVTALALGPHGALWIATFGGIVRFDGVGFEPLSKENRDALGNNRVTALYTARDGTLWIGNESQGLMVLRDGRIQRLPGSDALPSQVAWITEDTRGRLWIATDHGAWVLEEGRFHALPEIVDSVNHVVAAPDDTIWLACSHGLFRVRGDTVEMLSGNEHTAVARTPDGTVWAFDVERHTIDEWREGAGVPLRYAGREHPVSRMLVRSTGELWLADEGILVHGPEGFRSIAPSLSTRVTLARTLLEDGEGSLWVGGVSGLLRLRRAPLVGYPGDLDSPTFVLAPADPATPGRLFVALYNGRVWEMSDGAWEPSSLLRSATTLGIGADGSVLAAASDVGLLRAKHGAASVLLGLDEVPSGRLEGVLETTDGFIWLSGDAEIRRIRGTDVRRFDTREPRGCGKVQTLLEASNGDVWWGQRKGLTRTRDGAVVRTWHAGRDLGSADVRTLLEGPDGTLWIGTYGGGLYWMTPEGGLGELDVDEGLYEDVVSFLAIDDDGWVVLLGNRAVSRIRYDDLLAVAHGERERLEPQVFSTGPGIGEFEGNGGAVGGGWAAPGGWIWFPTQEGLARFDPTALEPPLPPATPYVTSLVVDGIPYPVGDVVKTPPGERNLTFHFTAGTLVDADKVRFHYRLDGFDTRWIDCGTRREAIYTRVPHGSYRFRVAATNRDGVPSEREASVGLRLAPRFYETLWFRGLVGLAGALAVVGAWVFRTKHVRRRAHVLEERVAARTAELVEARERLEERVEERTRQLREDMARRQALEGRLRESQRLEALGRLAGGLAHDFNNYLTIVMADSHLALQELEHARPDASAVRSMIGQIEATSRRAADLTRKLLAYSRRQVLEPRVIDVNEALRALQRMLGRLVREDIEMRYELDPEARPVLVDPTQFEQVVLNLVANANDAIEGMGHITIRTEARAPSASGPGSTVIVVRDDGHGIDSASRERIFEPFYSTKPVGKGSGLGLASVAGIVEQSGGRIDVRGSSDRGTTFEIAFPVSAESLVRREPQEPDYLPRPSKARILLCDDQKEVGQAIAMMLEALGYEVMAFQDPLALLASAEDASQDFDLLLTDVVMPGMSGGELATRLAARHPGLRVLFLSGYASGEWDGTIELEEHCRFLQKPFDIRTLAMSVSELLGGRPSEHMVGERSSV